MSSSDDSSETSRSPPQSPETSYVGPPNLERLVLHFVAAKKSLNSTSHVYRANELVTESRHLIEEIAVLTARNAFAQRGLDDQVEILETIKESIVNDANHVSSDFKTTISSLDKAHQRLERTLGALRKTIVDTSSPVAQESSQADSRSEAETTPEDEVDQKTLYDFIDESNHEGLLSSLRGLIDTFHLARADLDNNITSYEKALKDIAASVSDTEEDSALPDKPTIYDEPPLSLQQLFRGTEEHATEVASLLENLVKHYDLCVTALKHTEGGGAAAKEAVAAEDLAKGISDPEESLYRTTVPAPMDAEERMEMLTVLEKDALEVDDVTIEIRDREIEMEERYQQISKYASKARQRNKTLRGVLDLLHQIRAEIPTHLDAIQTFRSKWQDIRISMQAKTEEVGELGAFYEQFLSGYSKLLREVERRSASEAHMKKVADKARRDMDRLYEADQRARKEFMEDVGAYLPSNIWDGFTQEAPKWEIRAVLPEDRGSIQDGADDQDA